MAHPPEREVYVPRGATVFHNLNEMAAGNHPTSLSEGSKLTSFLLLLTTNPGFFEATGALKPKLRQTMDWAQFTGISSAPHGKYDWLPRLPVDFAARTLPKQPGGLGSSFPHCQRKLEEPHLRLNWAPAPNILAATSGDCD